MGPLQCPLSIEDCVPRREEHDQKHQLPQPTLASLLREAPREVTGKNFGRIIRIVDCSVSSFLVSHFNFGEKFGFGVCHPLCLGTTTLD